MKSYKNKVVAPRGVKKQEERGRELRSTNFSYKISHGEAMNSTGNVVNNIIITMEGDRWLLHLLWWSHRKTYECWITLLYTWHSYCMSTMKELKPYTFSSLHATSTTVWALFSTVSLYKDIATAYVLLLYPLNCLSFGPHYVVKFCVFKFHCCLNGMKLSSLNEGYCVLNIAWNFKKIGHLKNTFCITSFLYN